MLNDTMWISTPFAVFIIPSWAFALLGAVSLFGSFWLYGLLTNSYLSAVLGAQGKRALRPVRRLVAICVGAAVVLRDLLWRLVPSSFVLYGSTSFLVRVATATAVAYLIAFPKTVLYYVAVPFYFCVFALRDLFCSLWRGVKWAFTGKKREFIILTAGVVSGGLYARKEIREKKAKSTEEIVERERLLENETRIPFLEILSRLILLASGYAAIASALVNVDISLKLIHATQFYQLITRMFPSAQQEGECNAGNRCCLFPSNTTGWYNTVRMCDCRCHTPDPNPLREPDLRGVGMARADEGQHRSWWPSRWSRGNDPEINLNAALAAADLVLDAEEATWFRRCITTVRVWWSTYRAMLVDFACKTAWLGVIFIIGFVLGYFCTFYYPFVRKYGWDAMLKKLGFGSYLPPVVPPLIVDDDGKIIGIKPAEPKRGDESSGDETALIRRPKEVKQEVALDIVKQDPDVTASVTLLPNGKVDELRIICSQDSTAVGVKGEHLSLTTFMVGCYKYEWDEGEGWKPEDLVPYVAKHMEELRRRDGNETRKKGKARTIRGGNFKVNSVPGPNKVRKVRFTPSHTGYVTSSETDVTEFEMSHSDDDHGYDLDDDREYHAFEGPGDFEWDDDADERTPMTYAEAQGFDDDDYVTDAQFKRLYEEGLSKRDRQWLQEKEDQYWAAYDARFGAGGDERESLALRKAYDRANRLKRDPQHSLIRWKALEQKISTSGKGCGQVVAVCKPGDESKGKRPLKFVCPLCPPGTGEHPISRCPKNKDHRWKYVSYLQLDSPKVVQFGDTPVDYPVEFGHVFDSHVLELKARKLVRVGSESKIPNQPIIEIERIVPLGLPLGSNNSFEDSGFAAGSYVGTVYHGYMGEKQKELLDMEGSIPLKVALRGENVPAIWGSDDFMLYERPQTRVKDGKKEPYNLPTGSLAKNVYKPEIGKTIWLVGFLNGKQVISQGTIIKINAPQGAETTTELCYDASSDNGLSGCAMVDPINYTLIGYHTGTEQKGSLNRGRLFSQEMLDFMRKAPVRIKKFKQEN